MSLKCHDFDTNEKLALTYEKWPRHMQPAVLEQPRRYTGSYSASGSPFQLHNVSKLVAILYAGNYRCYHCMYFTYRPAILLLRLSQVIAILHGDRDDWPLTSDVSWKTARLATRDYSYSIT